VSLDNRMRLQSLGENFTVTNGSSFSILTSRAAIFSDATQSKGSVPFQSINAFFHFVDMQCSIGDVCSDSSDLELELSKSGKEDFV
jgi:hypothetical protein